MPQKQSRAGRNVVDQVPKVFRLQSIKSRIVGLALAATLIPSLAMAWVSFNQNRAALTDRIDEELQSIGAQTARELDLWSKERLYDVRVFASSYVVSENIERALGADSGDQWSALLYDYLTSVGERFPDYNELMVVDREGQVLASSAESPGRIYLPPDWLDRVVLDQAVIGDAYFDEEAGQPLMSVAVPVTAADQTLVGSFVANVTFRAVRAILFRFAPGNSGNLYVIAPDGATILSIRTDTRPFADRKLSPATTQLLFSSEGRPPVAYNDFSGSEVLGTLKRVPSLDWAVVAEIPAEEAYAQVVQLRDVTALVVMALLVVVGFIAYGLGLLIVRPLDRLTTGAAEVAAGDLAVDLPVGRGEVGYLTEVFNGMVDRLREGREKLEGLLVTDPLTGISNRRHLMERLRNEARRSRRSKRSFAILMADVDHFKDFNDTHGHIAGDEALKVVAEVLNEGMREIDHVARYGGEEFLAMMPNTPIDGAFKAAERIRKRLANRTIRVGQESLTLTISIGVAEFPIHGDSAESLIMSADAALYEAKDAGRDRVVRASKTSVASSSKEPTEPTSKATGTKATARKAPAKKATAGKATAGKATAGKATAGKAPAKKAPAKRATARKAPAGKAPAKKATTKKTATKATGTRKKAAAKSTGTTKEASKKATGTTKTAKKPPAAAKKPTKKSAVATKKPTATKKTTKAA